MLEMASSSRTTASQSKLGKRKAREESSPISSVKAIGLSCCLKRCSSKIIKPEVEGHVEIKAGFPEGNKRDFKQNSAVEWTHNGEVMFHENCWKELIRNCRVRSLKNVTIKLSEAEKTSLKEASKTAEQHDSLEQLKREAARIASLIRGAKHCISFTGAGISTSAGIGDYRGKGGKWTEMDREAVISKTVCDLSSGDADSPIDLTQEEETNDDGVPYERLRPTYTHEALHKLMEMGFLKHIISQNGDGLHGLSGIAAEDLSELHGNVFLEVCEKCCHPYYRSCYVMDDLASQYFEELEDFGSSDVVKPRHAKKCTDCGLNHRTGRRCDQPGCKGFLKDSIINFGDNLEEEILTNAEHQAEEADLIISLGTTMKVTPACDLVVKGKKPLRIVIVNRQKTPFDDLCYERNRGKLLGSRVFGDCDIVLRQIMHHLMSDRDREEWEAKRGERMREYDKLRDQ